MKLRVVMPAVNILEYSIGVVLHEQGNLLLARGCLYRFGPAIMFGSAFTMLAFFMPFHDMGASLQAYFPLSPTRGIDTQPYMTIGMPNGNKYMLCSTIRTKAVVLE